MSDSVKLCVVIDSHGNSILYSPDPLGECLGGKITEALKGTFYFDVEKSTLEKLLLNSLSNEILTPRQLEIINLVKAGKSYREIGEYLSISPSTVKYHLNILFKKYDVKNRMSLMNVLKV